MSKKEKLGQKKTAAGKAARSRAIAERRRLVALLLRTGMEQQEVAQELGVSDATISGDVAALKEAWARSATADVAEMVVQERSALDLDEVRWREWMEGAETPTSKARCYDIIMSIMHRRSQLVGLDSVLRRKQAEMEKEDGGLDALLEEAMSTEVDVRSDENAEGEPGAV